MTHPPQKYHHVFWLIVLTLDRRIENNRLGELPLSLPCCSREFFLHNNDLSAIPPALSECASVQSSLVITLGGNPSVCTRIIAPELQDTLGALVCDCAPGFFGTSDCQAVASIAHQTQNFASSRAHVEIAVPDTAVRFVSREGDTAYVWTKCGSSFGDQNLVIEYLSNGKATMRFSRDCVQPIPLTDDTPDRVSLTGFVSKASDGSVTRYATVPVAFVNSAFAYVHEIPAEDTKLFSAEIGRRREVPITKEVLNLGRNVAPNPSIPAKIRYSVQGVNAADTSPLCAGAVTVIQGDDSGAGAKLHIFANTTMPRGNCFLSLFAIETETREELMLVNMSVDIRDCYDRCGMHGKCVDTSPSPYDGISSHNCACDAGFTGILCNTRNFIVEWRGWEDDKVVTTLPDGVLGIAYSSAPNHSHTLYAVLGQDDVSGGLEYSASNLPFGLDIDRNSGAISGTPLQAGSYAVEISVTSLLSSNNYRTTKLNNKALTLQIAECDHSTCLNGGTCLNGELPYDGVFTCDCSGTGMTGGRCEVLLTAVLRVVWRGVPPRLPVAVLGADYTFSGPDPESVLVEGGSDDSSATGVSSLTYLATGLPCGLEMDNTTGAIMGIAQAAAAEAKIIIFARTAAGQTAEVNQRAFTLQARECDDGLTCNGGTCMPGSSAFDGEFSCDCSNTNNNGTFCDVPVPQVSESKAAFSDTIIGIIAGVSGAVAITLLVLAVFIVRRTSRRQAPFKFDDILQQMKNEGLVQAASEPGVPREMSRRGVQLLDKLGSGQFGDVHKAMIKDNTAGVGGGLGGLTAAGSPSFLAAVKTLKEGSSSADKRELMEEAALMAQLQHANLVGIVGVCTRSYPILLVLEYCEHGSLLSFLRKRTGFDALGLVQRLKVALDCAKGMAYLSEAGVVHRDLAARNVLVDSAYTCKVADFGLSRRMDNDYYRASGAGALPLRWTAIEIFGSKIEARRYTPATDAWSYGVLLHEIFTNGAKPYDGMANAVVLARVSEGYRLPRPTECPLAVYKLVMCACWDADAAARPNFARIVSLISTRMRAAERESAATIAVRESAHDSVVTSADAGDKAGGTAADTHGHLSAVAGAGGQRSTEGGTFVARRGVTASPKMGALQDDAYDILESESDVTLNGNVRAHDYEYDDVAAGLQLQVMRGTGGTGQRRDKLVLDQNNVAESAEAPDMAEKSLHAQPPELPLRSVSVSNGAGSELVSETSIDAAGQMVVPTACAYPTTGASSRQGSVRLSEFEGSLSGTSTDKPSPAGYLLLEPEGPDLV